MRYWGHLTISLSLILASCGTTRKISEVGLREPGSVVSASGVQLSEEREQLLSLSHVSSFCSPNFKTDFVTLLAERLQLSDCPGELAPLLHKLDAQLQMDERSLLETLLNSHCQGLLKEDQAEQLQVFIDNLRSSGPIGRHIASSGASDQSSEQYQDLLTLRNSLQTLVSTNIPLERWLAQNGQFVIPESSLKFYATLIKEKSCVLADEDFDRAYQHLQQLEELERLLPDGKQRQLLRSTLDALHKIVDRKVTEFFSPRKS